MTNIGIITSMPISIDQLSAIQPITGSTNNPGITHNEPMAKPVARARGGIASESAASTPGPMIANDAEITQLSATAMYTFGAKAKPADATDVSIATVATNRIRPLMLPAKRRVAMRAPSTSPTSANGSETAAATPRARSSSPNFWSYNSEASVTNPISEVARNGSAHQMRWSDRTLWAVRQLSANDGDSSSVSMISCDAPVAWRSQRPRIGSFIRRASTAKITVGITNTRNGTRQSK